MKMLIPNPQSRGIPTKDSPIHLMRKGSRNVYCGNGSWHIFYQSRKEFVTCEKCIEQLEKEQ